MFTLLHRPVDPCAVTALADALDAVEAATTPGPWRAFLRAAVGGEDPGLTGLVLCARLLVQMRPTDADTPLGELRGSLAAFCAESVGGDATFEAVAGDVLGTVLADGHPTAGYAAALDAGAASTLVLVAWNVIGALCAMQQTIDQRTDHPSATLGDPLRRVVLPPGPQLAGIYTLTALDG